MANSDFFPVEVAFETSDFTEFTSTVDVDAKFTNDHFIKMVNQLGKFSGVLPYKGAYSGHIDLSVGTNPAYGQSTAVTAALSTTLWVRMFWQATSNLVMAASDRFTILSIQSVGAVDQATISVLNNAGTIQLVAAQTGITAIGAATRQAEFSRDEWHLIEIGVTVDSGANDGTLQFWLDGFKQGATITGLTQAAITQMRAGVTTTLNAGTTAGHLFYDNIAQTLAQEGGSGHNRYPQTVVLTKSGWVALGPGRVAAYSLMPGGAADNFMSVHDMDRQPLLSTNDTFGSILSNTHAFEAKTYAYSKADGFFNRGCYVRLTGTAPRAVVVLAAAQVGSGVLRQYAMRKN